MQTTLTRGCFAAAVALRERGEILVQCTECSYEWRESDSQLHGVFCPVCGSSIEEKKDLGLELV